MSLRTRSPGRFPTLLFYLTPSALSLLTPPTQYGYTTSAPRSDSVPIGILLLQPPLGPPRLTLQFVAVK